MSEHWTCYFATYSKEEGTRIHEPVTLRVRENETMLLYMDKEGKPYPVVMPKEEVGE